MMVFSFLFVCLSLLCLFFMNIFKGKSSFWYCDLLTSHCFVLNIISYILIWHITFRSFSYYLYQGLFISWAPALCLAPNFYLPALAPNLHLPAMAPNLYLPALVWAPSLYLPVLTPSLYLLTLTKILHLPALVPKLYLPTLTSAMAPNLYYQSRTRFYYYYYYY